MKRIVFASSSAVYGDHPALPKVENQIGQPLSPYAVTKLVNELYAGVFARNYGIELVGLRYFNVFGPRQDPLGAYAAVVPRWIHSLLENLDIEIYGDGSTSRDFCYVKNVVQANLLAATTELESGSGHIFNVAAGERNSKRTVFENHRMLEQRNEYKGNARNLEARTGDIQHSLADINHVEALLGYRPTHGVSSGLEETVNWFIANSGI